MVQWRKGEPDWEHRKRSPLIGGLQVGTVQCEAAPAAPLPYSAEEPGRIPEYLEVLVPSMSWLFHLLLFGSVTRWNPALSGLSIAMKLSRTGGPPRWPRGIG